jgi:hypothetical protein
MVSKFAFKINLYRYNMDDVTSVSTSPHDGTKGQTWQQAVQYFEEIKVEKGGVLPMVAKHDTYGITFQVGGSRGERTPLRLAH